MELYTHTEQPTSRLMQRLSELAWMEDHITYSEERKRQVGHEVMCICFELNFRDDLHHVPAQVNMPHAA